MGCGSDPFCSSFVVSSKRTSGPYNLAQLPRGGSWGSGGIIIFADRPDGPLFQVSSSGGTRKQVTKLNQSRGEATHRWPCFLPDGRRFLFFVRITKKIRPFMRDRLTLLTQNSSRMQAPKLSMHRRITCCTPRILPC
jgi:hypothetical protein